MINIKQADKINKVEDLLNYIIEKKMKPEDFDYKCMYQHVLKQKTEKIIEKIDDANDFVKLWEIYKEDTKIDFDNSGNTFPFMSNVYDLLWHLDKNGQEINLQNEFKLSMGPDVLNTVATKINKYYFPENEKAKWQESINEYKGEEEINTLCHINHSIGAFLLVPYSYNRDRGRDTRTKDFDDISLYYLKNGITIKKNYYMFVNNIDKFKQYINFQFLWDFVDEKYNVKPMIENCKFEIGQYNGKEKITEYINNAERNTNNRSRFMFILMILALKDEKRYCDLLETVFKSSNNLVDKYKKTLVIIDEMFDKDFDDYEDFYVKNKEYYNNIFSCFGN